MNHDERHKPADLPRVRALLVHLLGLDVKDEQLPISVLVRLHPEALKRPLRNIAQVVPRKSDDVLLHVVENHIEQILQTEYPGLNEGQIFDRSGEVRVAYAQNFMDTDLWEQIRVRGAESDPVVVRLIGQLPDGWHMHEAPGMLYLMADQREEATAYANLLEVELGLHAQVRQMIEDFH